MTNKPYAKNTVMFENTNRTSENTADERGLHHHPEEKFIMWVSESANSSGEHTLDILDPVILPGVGVVNADINVGCILVDRFRGLARDITKDRNSQLEKVYFCILSGGITPKDQHLDILDYRYLYYEYMLHSPINTTSGNPISPSTQIITHWVVEAWEKVSEELVCKSFRISGHKDATTKSGSVCTDTVSSASKSEQQDKIMRLIAFTTGEESVTAYIEQEKFGGSDTSSMQNENNAIYIDNVRK